MMKKIIPFLLLLFSLSAFAEESKPLVSVFDFKGPDISENEVFLFVDFLTSEIVNTGKYNVIDRNQRETLLSEIEFSLTGCTDESCQLEAGKLLHANMIVTGSLDSFGEGIRLNMKLTEVETGAVISSVTQQYNSFNDVIADNTRLVNILLNPSIQAEKTPIPSNYHIYTETEEMIRDDISKNFIFIQKNAKSLSPEQRQELYDANKRNPVTGTLLSIVPGFGTGAFINGDIGTGVMQLSMDLLGTAGVIAWSVNDKKVSDWEDSNMGYWVPDPNGSQDMDGVLGDFIIDGQVYNPNVEWMLYVGVGSLISFGVSRIVSGLIAGTSYGSYNEDLGSALNLSN